MSLKVDFEIFSHNQGVALLQKSPLCHSLLPHLPRHCSVPWEGNTSVLPEKPSRNAELTQSHWAEPWQHHLNVPKTSRQHPFSWGMLLGWTTYEWRLQGTLQRWHANPYMALVTEGCKDAGWISVSDQKFWNVPKKRSAGQTPPALQS